MFPESISAEEIEQLPLGAFEGPITVITEKGPDYAEAIDYLTSQKAIGFDTETKPSFTHGSPRNKVALLQLSGKDKAYLFRLHHIGVTLEVAKILSDPNILKIGAAVTDDVHGLTAKYRQFPPRGFVDLQILAQHYGIKDKSVKKMAAIILGIKVSKAQQLSNWEAPNLSGAQLKYAATDAWVCLEMYEELLGCEKTVSEEEALHMPATVVIRERKPKQPAHTPMKYTPEERKAIDRRKRKERRKRAQQRKREAKATAEALAQAAGNAAPAIQAQVQHQSEVQADGKE